MYHMERTQQTHERKRREEANFKGFMADSVQAN
jgi:hypothetical protein